MGADAAGCRDHFPRLFFTRLVQISRTSGSNGVIAQPAAVVLKCGQGGIHLRACREQGNQVMSAQQRAAVVNEERLKQFFGYLLGVKAYGLGKIVWAGRRLQSRAVFLGPRVRPASAPAFYHSLSQNAPQSRRFPPGHTISELAMDFSLRALKSVPSETRLV